MLFGRKKQRTHAQALGFMTEWQAMMGAASNSLTYGMTDEEMEAMGEDKIMEIIVEFIMALLGVLGYMVAGLGHPEVSQEMLEIFKKNFASYPPEMNPKNYSPTEAALKVNEYYQQATKTSEQLMSEGKGLEHITHAHAKGLFDWIGTGASEEDVTFMENCLNTFYKDAYDKYYG